MTLMQGEKMLRSFGHVTLTTHRLRAEIAAAGYTKVISIMLEELDSCDYERLSKWWLLLLAGLSVVFGVVLGARLSAEGQSRDASIAVVLTVCVGFFLTVRYFGSRKAVLQLLSKRSTIDFPVENSAEASELIDTIENAKASRLAQAEIR